jgi:hypothetical protein
MALELIPERMSDLPTFASIDIIPPMIFASDGLIHNVTVEAVEQMLAACTESPQRLVRRWPVKRRELCESVRDCLQQVRDGRCSNPRLRECCNVHRPHQAPGVQFLHASTADADGTACATLVGNACSL